MSCLIVLDVCDNKVDIKDERTQSEHTMKYQKDDLDQKDTVLKQD